MTENVNNYTPSCKACGGKCCNYVAIEIDKPTTKSNCDHIRWYLLHENINVFVDHDKNWFVEFRSPCTKLDKHMRCSIYSQRPKICREHGLEEESCEFYDSPYFNYFTTAAEFEKYLNKKKFNWRFKNLK